MVTQPETQLNVNESETSTIGFWQQLKEDPSLDLVSSLFSGWVVEE